MPMRELAASPRYSNGRMNSHQPRHRRTPSWDSQRGCWVTTEDLNPDTTAKQRVYKSKFNAQLGPADAARPLLDTPVRRQECAVAETNGGRKTEPEACEFIDAGVAGCPTISEGTRIVQQPLG